jgi:hypothetical protein
VQHGKRVGVGLPAQPRPEARVQWMGARRAGRRGNEVRRSPARPATAPHPLPWLKLAKFWNRASVTLRGHCPERAKGRPRCGGREAAFLHASCPPCALCQVSWYRLARQVAWSTLPCQVVVLCTVACSNQVAMLRLLDDIRHADHALPPLVPMHAVAAQALQHVSGHRYKATGLRRQLRGEGNVLRRSPMRHGSCVGFASRAPNAISCAGWL